MISLPPQASLSRGLTLLETLIATAILAMIAAACVPVIARAMVLLGPSSATPNKSTVQMADLSLVADAFMNDPSAFGIDRKALPELEAFQIAWPEDDSAHPAPSTDVVEVKVQRATDAEVKHAWIAFNCEDLVVLRWLALPERDPHDSQGGRP